MAADGDLERDNPNSAAVWHYIGANPKDFEQTMHRTCGTVAIKNDLLIIADFSGVVHCLDSKTGTAHWTHDMLAASWASPLIADNKIYIGDEDGDILIFELSPEKKRSPKSTSVQQSTPPRSQPMAESISPIETNSSASRKGRSPKGSSSRYRDGF